MVNRIQCVICRFSNQNIRGKHFKFGWEYQEPIIPGREKILISIHGQQNLFYFSKLSKEKISELKLRRESTLSLIKV